MRPKNAVRRLVGGLVVCGSVLLAPGAGHAFGADDGPEGRAVRAELPWGATGHRIVGLIAERHMTAEALGAARALLHGQSLARIASWADDYRGTDEGRYTSTWHYATVPPGTSYAYTDDDNIDVGEAIRDQQLVLADLTAPVEERRMALMFLVHFIGDVHQPMHVGNGDDRGGNDVRTRWFGNDRNLHSVWDSGIIEHHGLSYTEFVDFIDHATAEQVAEWQRDSELVWIRESHELRDVAYEAMGDAEVPNLSWEYRNRMTPHIERRLLQGGIRLAGVLNRILGG